MTPPAASPSVPGRIRYLAAVAIFLVGMAGMAVFLIGRLSGMEEGLTRFVVPGERTIPLEAGDYTIFHEMQSVVDGTIYASTGLSGLTVSVNGPGGSAVPLAAAGSGRYTFGGHTGFAVFDFTAPAAGDYTIAARYDDGATEPETVLAVGRGFMASLLGTIFGGLGIAFAGAIIASVLAVRTLIARRRAGLRF